LEKGIYAMVEAYSLVYVTNSNIFNGLTITNFAFSLFFALAVTFSVVVSSYLIDRSAVCLCARI
jgi:hypothetical protein